MTGLTLQDINCETHERVVRVSDPSCGLKAINVIHSTTLGPAGGGCRLWAYDNEQEALTDVLRLSEGMTYKNALANVGMGGGKAVIMGPIDRARRAEVFLAFGRAVEALGGAYVTAEDVGVAVDDINTIARETKWVTGFNVKEGVGGDPAPHTAKGVLRGLEAAAHLAFQKETISGLRVAVQGLGSVGARLCELLVNAGAEIIISDINSELVNRVQDSLGADVTEPENILRSDADILAPCALGGVITPEVARHMRAKVIAGAANNQLASPEVAGLLQERGIVYAPDYVINAGGIIMAAAEFHQKRDPNRISNQINSIYERTRSILKIAAESSTSPSVVADQLARELVSEKAKSPPLLV